MSQSITLGIWAVWVSFEKCVSVVMAITPVLMTVFVEHLMKQPVQHGEPGLLNPVAERA
ncbi:hypothetical protein D3C86_1969930 [compost metagenome]